MAYPIPISGIVEITLQTKVCEQTCLSLFHYINTSSSISDGGAAIVQMLAAIDTGSNLVSRFLGCVAEDVQLTGIYGQYIAPFRFRRLQRTPTIGTGSFEGQATNPSAAVAFTKGADVAVRGGTGTLHLPGIATMAMVNGRTTGDFKAAADFLELQITQPITTTGPTATWNPVIYRRANPTQSLRITSCQQEDTIRTMRRRVVGRGI